MKKAIRAAISAYPPPVREALYNLRELVLETAKNTEGVGPVEEDLRWGQPSFLTLETGSGSTIRIDGFRDDPDRYAMFFHCQSGLIPQFRELYRDRMKFVGDRSIEFTAGGKLPVKELKHCISLALTHHLRKKSGGRHKKKQ